MKFLVFGVTGQVACELARRAPAGVAIRSLGREEADLCDPAACAAAIAACDADAIINAAAWTAVDNAETDEEAATVVNGAAPGAMAAAARARGVPFLHISTDYVFDGKGTEPFAPDHPVAPLGAYGRSKLAGEKAIRAAGGQHLILRTSWVVSCHGTNFVKTMLRLGAERETLNVVADQIGGPTPAADIADTLIDLAQKMVRGASGGTYHFSGAPDTSWAALARAIMSKAGLSCTVTDIASSDFPTPATRPLNSRLDCSALERDFSICRPDWQAGVSKILEDLASV